MAGGGDYRASPGCSERASSRCQWGSGTPDLFAWCATAETCRRGSTTDEAGGKSAQDARAEAQLAEARVAAAAAAAAAKRKREEAAAKKSKEKQPDMILIHVHDDRVGESKDFRCTRSEIVKYMKYFERFLARSDGAEEAAEEVDISVHCDIAVFEWLVQFMRAPAAAELEQEQPLREDLKTTYRSSAARCNYVAADRPDAQFACKEVCRWMSSPNTTSWQGLKRLVRFFCGAPRLVYEFP